LTISKYHDGTYLVEKDIDDLLNAYRTNINVERIDGINALIDMLSNVGQLVNISLPDFTRSTDEIKESIRNNISAM
jgi:hypothetical protein